VVGDFNGDGRMDVATANYGSSNVSVLLGNDTELLNEDLLGNGVRVGFGRGNIATSDDVDYWKFTGKTGDRLTLTTETPGSPSGSSLFYRILKADGNVLTEFGSNGNGFGQSSTMTLPTTGTYLIRVSYNNLYFGEYRFRVTEVTPPVQTEVEENGGVSNGNTLSFVTDQGALKASVVGAIRANGDLDYFNLGTITSGSTVFLNTRLLAGSDLIPVVAIYDGSNGYVVEAGSGRPFDSVGQVDITQTGNYFAVVRGGQATGGLLAQYILDVQIVPTGSISFPNLQAVTVTPPTATGIRSGQVVPFSFVIQNVGSVVTPTANWDDRVVISRNTILGDGDDIPMGVFPHSGALDPGVNYTVSKSVKLPDGIEGDFYLIVQTDSGNTVSEFVLEGDNITASDNTFHIALADYPDLRVENLTLTGPDAQNHYAIRWSTANRGVGPAVGGFKERISIQDLQSSAMVLNIEHNVSNDLAVDATNSGEVIFSPSTVGSFQASVATDSADQLFEMSSSGHVSAEQNTVSLTFAVGAAVNTLPTISTIGDQQLLTGQSTPALPFVISDLETPSANLTLTAVSSNPAVIPAVNIIFGGSDANRTVTVTSLPGQTGNSTITITVSDGQGGIANTSFSVTVAQRPPLNVAGVAFDGYIARGAVFFDANFNHTPDTGEPVAQTDGQGRFALAVQVSAFDKNGNGALEPDEGNLVLIGGQDIATGFPQRYPLFAPINSSVINPLTTLITEVLIKPDVPPTLAEAQAKLASSLGLNTSIDFLQYDPFAAANGGDPLAGGVLGGLAKVEALRDLGAAFLASATDHSSDFMAEELVKLLADKILAGTSLDLSNAATVKGLLQEIATGLGATMDAAKLDAASQIISEVNHRIDLAAAVTPSADAARKITQVQVVAQGKLTDDLNQLGAGALTPADALAADTGGALDLLITNAPIGDVFGNDTRPGTFQFFADQFRVTESGLPIKQVTIARTDGNSGPVDLIIELADGTATLAGGDYAASQLHVTMPDRALLQLVDLTSVLQDDHESEPDETINLHLTLAPGAPAGAVIGRQADAVLTLVDDDHAPVAGADQFQTIEGTPLPLVTGDLLANDHDADLLDHIAVAEVATASAQGGTVTLTGSTIIYQPPANFSGTDLFTYVISDDTGLTGTGEVTVAVLPRGFEADLSPRPGGSNNGQVTIVDWVQIGRFAIGLDQTSNANEFMRADCAPRQGTAGLLLGDGQLDIADWVQAGRYAAGLDPATAAGGPRAPVAIGLNRVVNGKARLGLQSESATGRRVSLVAGVGGTEQSRSVIVALQSLGNEAAVGFSLDFPREQLRFRSAQIGVDAAGAILLVNTNRAADGALGLGLSLPAGKTFPSGARQLIQIDFDLISAIGAAALSFGDAPVNRLVVDSQADPVQATFEGMTLPLSDVSGAGLAQPKLQLIGRAPSGGVNLRLSGTPGAKYLLEGSSDLIHWSARGELTLTGSSVEIPMETSASSPIQFYRARLP